MKLSSLRKLLVSTVVATTMVAGMSVAAQAAEWRGWNIHKDGYPNTIAMDKFAEKP